MIVGTEVKGLHPPDGFSFCFVFFSCSKCLNEKKDSSAAGGCLEKCSAQHLFSEHIFVWPLWALPCKKFSTFLERLWWHHQSFFPTRQSYILKGDNIHHFWLLQTVPCTHIPFDACLIAGVMIAEPLFLLSSSSIQSMKERIISLMLTVKK